MSRSVTLSLALVLISGSAAAVVAPGPDGRPHRYDARSDRGSLVASAGLLRSGATSSAEPIAGPVAEPGARRLAELRRLEALGGGAVEVRWNPITGSPALLHARSGWLSGPDGRSAELVARDFLGRHAALFGLSSDEAAALPLEASVPLSGGTVLHFRQELAGLPVDHGHLAVGLAEDGRVLSLAGGLVTNGPGFDPRPQLDPLQAVTTMARAVGVAEPAPERLPSNGPGVALRLSGFSHAEVDLELVAFPTAWGPRLAWKARLDAASHDAAWVLLVDDRSGRLLSLLDLTRHADTRGRVFAEDPAASSHDVRRFVDREDWRSDLSPLGWADADQTVGNNAVVRDDGDGDNEMTLGVVATASPAPPYLLFDFPYTGTPAVDLDAALSQLFYGINFAHDRLQELGFDEASGNYQAVNLGSLGLGGDPVLGDVHDIAAANNANFTPDRDGRSGRMQMGIWGTAPAERDSSFDTGVVVHEFLHGVSMRLVGGPSDVACLGLGQDGAMGEGWGDFFAASFFENPLIGAWVSGDPAGIRMFRLDDNPPTGKDYRDYCTTPYQDGLGGCEVHANGEIWAGLLWKIREGYVALHGAAGASMVERLVIDALKLTPCFPSMLDARDALILADRLSTGGRHECLIKTEAAGRWMGFSASSAGAGDQMPVAANDHWPECIDAGTVRFGREPVAGSGALPSYACEDLVEVVVVDGNASLPLQVTLTTPAGDAETLDLAAGAGPATFLASIAATSAAPAVGDGTLQVVQGEIITVSYSDVAPAAVLTAEAAVSCLPGIAIRRHFIRNSNCDADEVPGFPELPGFLDAGESADLVLELTNPNPHAVSGRIDVTTDRPDLVQLVAVNPRVVLPAAQGPDFPGRVDLIVRLSAEQDFLGATELGIDLSLVAAGYDPAVFARQVLRLDLDYSVETGVIVADGAEAETGGPVGPAWTTGTLMAGGNQWTLVPCHASEGVQSYRNGPDTCAGNYSDAQGVPWLAFPAIDFGAAGAEAARITNVSFQHDVDLAGGPGQFSALGADAVALLATADPSLLDLSNPLSLLTDALGAYANLPDFGFDSNTAGFEPQSIDVPPPALPNLDQLQPFFLTWIFYPDVIAPAIGFPRVGGGYYVDDVVVTYDRVIAVPSAARCLTGATVASRPEFAAPASARAAGSACAGDAVHLDASDSDGVHCVPFQLDYRFLVGGMPVACATDATGMTLRLQDPDGWATSPDCWDFPLADTLYEVEVRCQAEPLATDLRPLGLRVLDGLALVAASPAGFCSGAGVPVMLDASESALVGCPGERLYRFVDGLGAELDCDGDGNPDGFVTDPTCELIDTGLDQTVVVELACEALPGCTVSDSLVVPALNIAADAAEVAGPGTLNCIGVPFDVTGAGSAASGCAGSLEYRWTDGAAWDTGWTGDPVASATLTADGDLQLEVRCDTAPDCIAAATLPVLVRDGAISLSSGAGALDCPDTAFVLQASEDLPVECGGGREYRFLADPDGLGFATIDCDGDGAPDDWGVSSSCSALLLAGGADFIVEVRCTDDPGCTFGSAPLRVTPWDGVPTGAPPGTLRAGRLGTCQAGPIDVMLDWSDSGRVPPAFAVLRGEQPVSPLDPQADVDGTNWTDAGLTCSDPARVLYRGADVLFYLVFDRNACTGALIDP